MSRHCLHSASLVLVLLLPFSAAAVEFSSPNPKSGGNFGISVAGAGDLNGNGSDDFIVGAPVENGDGPLGGLAGRIYVYDGSTGATIWDLFAPPFLGQRYGTTVAGGGDFNGDGVNDIFAGSLGNKALVFSGATGDTICLLEHPDGIFGTDFGVQVGHAGDFNDDGFDDVIVGAYNETIGGSNRAGRAYVFGGPDGALLATLESPLSNVGQFGISVDGAGDVDNDGFDDVIVGAFLDVIDGMNDAGRAYVFSGASHDTLFSVQAPTPLTSAQFGKSVAGVGDITGDGRSEVIVGAPGDTAPGIHDAGKAYVFDGADGSLLHDLVSPTPDFNAFLGTSVDGMGDYDGDGVRDLVVSAHLEDEAGVNGSGRVHVFSGATGLHLDTFVSPNTENFGRFGIAVAGAGDANGDGRADVIVGAGLEANAGLNDAGRAYLFYAPAPTSVLPSTSLRPRLDNYPNPFNPQTTLRFELARRGPVQLDIYDSRGRRVERLVDKELAPGAHAILWHADGLPSGTYFARLETRGEVESRRMSLVK